MTISDFSCVPGAPQSTDLPALQQFAEGLRAANYSQEAIATLIGDGAYAALQRDQIVPAQLQIEKLTDSADLSEQEVALALLVSFFLLGNPLTASELDQALNSNSGNAATLLRSLGVAEPNIAETAESTFRASVDIRPHSADDGVDIWVASDLPAHIRRGTLRKDHVLGIGHASRSLAQFTERQAAQRALDLGTGCGIQTFHLLSHCEHVTATDISERALGFTAFNLLLNASALGIDPQQPDDRVILKLGSLLEPVEGEKFDLVVSNPPFVITPRSEGENAASQFTYRDGGMAGDQIVSTLVRQLGTVLNDGGTAQMLGNWEIPGDSEEQKEWDERPRQWVGDSMEAWFIQREELTPEQYAETWLRDSSETADRAAFEASYRRYLLDFSARSVSAIGFGMIWLRRPAKDAPEPLLRRFEEITYPIQQPLGPFMTEAIELFDSSAHLSDEELLSLHLMVAPDVTEERHTEPGAEHPGVILLREGAGLRRTILESTATAGFVSACDGELSVGQIVGALEALLGWDGDSERQELLGHIRELILKGFLRIDAGN
ncbi:DUF7059 domain-containing protein [Rothia amarae]|uniref:DUF7059 domain-containing protein n=1 Tax=Rothia amarae TaxID=169480 RepID=UPI00366C2755